MRNRALRLKVLLPVLLLGLISGCASPLMIRTDKVVEPAPDYALVNFLRPAVLGGGVKFGIWDKENFIGILTPKNYIQYKASPGEHLFLARAENWAVIKGSLEAGKTYYILASPKMGAWKARVAMEVLRPDDPRLNEWMRSLTPSTVDPGKRDAYVQEWLEPVRKAVQNIEAGRADFIVINPSDGK